jgi:glucose-1-phosphate thymidylyltransferase
MDFAYIEQPARGLAQAYLLAADFLGGEASTMVLGDNIFYGHGLPEMLQARPARGSGRHGLRLPGADPERYGVAAFDAAGRVTLDRGEAAAAEIGLRGDRALRARRQRLRPRAAIRPSARGELEITDLLNAYRAEGLLTVVRMGRGYAWLDTGTHASLLEAGNFVRTIEERQNLKIGCPEEIAHAMGWIDTAALRALAEPYLKTEYGRYLMRIADAA